MDFNKLIARAKAVLITPKTEWPVIASEPATIGDLYKNYIVVLAAIPAIATFIKVSIIGSNVWLAGRVRVDVGAGLTSMIMSYVLTLASVYVVALIVDALAPTFNAQKDKTQALKTIAYAYTAGWIAGIAVIVPVVGGLIALAGGLYGIYLLYLGLPYTMKCPQEKAVGYTAVTVIATIVLYFLVAGIVGAITYSGLGAGGANYGGSTQISEDSPLGQLEEYGRNVEEATKKFEAAQKSGDQDAQNAALREMMGAALGGGVVEALAPDRLKPFLPETLMGMRRTDFTVERNNAMGMQISEARATYTDEASGRSVNLEITDTGTAKGLLALAGFSGMEGESESDGRYERVYRKNGRLIREQWDRADSTGEYAVVVADRFTVELAGEADDLDELRGALTDIDLRALEALKDEGTK